MTPASQRALLGNSRAPARRRARKSNRSQKKAAPARARVGARAGTRARKSRMKFGSPAWQKKYRVGAYAKGRRKK